MSKQLSLHMGLLSLLLAGCNLYSTSNTKFTPLSANATSSATSLGAKKVQLSWAASPGSPTGYQIEQSTDNSTFTQVQQLGLVTSATVTGLGSAKTYYFRVRSFNQGGESPYSQTATVTTGN